MHYLFLGIAICAEVAATTALKASEGFTQLIPSIIVVAGYGIAFFFLSLTLKSIPVGVAYAIWAGLGILLVAVSAAVIYKQISDLPAAIGMGLIIAGVIIISGFSKTTGH